MWQQQHCSVAEIAAAAAAGGVAVRQDTTVAAAAAARVKWDLAQPQQPQRQQVQQRWALVVAALTQ